LPVPSELGIRHFSSIIQQGISVKFMVQ